MPRARPSLVLVPALVVAMALVHCAAPAGFTTDDAPLVESGDAGRDASDADAGGDAADAEVDANLDAEADAEADAAEPPEDAAPAPAPAPSVRVDAAPPSSVTPADGGADAVAEPSAFPDPGSIPLGALPGGAGGCALGFPSSGFGAPILVMIVLVLVRRRRP